LCLPTAPALPPGENGDFGMVPDLRAALDKPLLAFVDPYWVPDVKHNRDREIKRRAPRVLSVYTRPHDPVDGVFSASSPF
jgi:hypothetical protein